MNRRDFLKKSVALTVSPMFLQHRGLAQASTPRPSWPQAGADGWVSLINGRDLNGWYTVLAQSGRDSDSAHAMVAMEENMLHILGNKAIGEPSQPGYIATHQEFEKRPHSCRIQMGYQPLCARLEAKRDNGLLYGLVGADKVWPHDGRMPD